MKDQVRALNVQTVSYRREWTDEYGYMGYSLEDLRSLCGDRDGVYGWRQLPGTTEFETFEYRRGIDTVVLHGSDYTVELTGDRMTCCRLHPSNERSTTVYRPFWQVQGSGDRRRVWMIVSSNVPQRFEHYDCVPHSVVDALNYFLHEIRTPVLLGVYGTFDFSALVRNHALHSTYRRSLRDTLTPKEQDQFVEFHEALNYFNSTPAAIERSINRLLDAAYSLLPVIGLYGAVQATDLKEIYHAMDQMWHTTAVGLEEPTLVQIFQNRIDRAQ